MKRTFRGAEYEITVSNPAKLAKDCTLEIEVDGKSIDGNIVPAFADGKTHTVKVIVK
jgi:cellobiose phosphorylase